MAKSSVVILLMLALISTVLSQGQMPLFSTETGYDLSFDQSKLNERVLSWRDLAARSGSAPPEGLENCDPVGSYIVYREGSSFPDGNDIMKLNALQNRIRTQTINPTYRFLSQIPNNRIPMSSAGELAESGRRELQELATRIKSRFPEFFRNPDVDLSMFDFQSTNATSSIESAVAFVGGLVGLNQVCETLSADGNVTVVCTENARDTRFPTPTSAFIPNNDASMDPLLLPYNVNKRARCLAAVNKRRTVREMNSFRMGREFTQLKDRIAQKLSPPGARPWNVSAEEVQLMAKICGYHQALFNDKNTWCRLFENDDLEVAEYERELQHYWDESYGFPLNSRVACPLINDTLEYFKMLTARGAGAGAGSSLPSMKLKFTDGNTLIRLVSLLGIAKDPRMLTATNYAQMRNRQFRSAKMAPFGGNLALNLYSCSEPGGVFFSDQTHRVQVVLNEQPVNMTFCQDSLCNLVDFQRELMKQAGQCMVDRECNIAMGLAPAAGGGGGGGGGGQGGRPLSGATNLNPAGLLVALIAMIAMKIGYTGL